MDDFFASEDAELGTDCGTVSPEGPSGLQAVNSLVFAVGAFSLTDLMPFSMDDADEYISLLPIVWPLLATSRKYGEPSLAVLRDPDEASLFQPGQRVIRRIARHAKVGRYLFASGQLQPFSIVG